MSVELVEPSEGQPPQLGGAVSVALEADLRSRIRTQGIVVWLDRHGDYTAFVDRLKVASENGQVPYAVQAFRGSYLDLMMSLDRVASGTTRDSLVVHLPGFSEDNVKDTPVYELYEAGVRYRKALDTLVSDTASGVVSPEAIKAFTDSPDLTLASADAWLDGHLSETSGGISDLLRAMGPRGVLNDLLVGKAIKDQLKISEVQSALWAQLAAWTGLPDVWKEATLSSDGSRPDDVAFVAASWALCVEYANDLTRDTVSEHLRGTRELPKGVIKLCGELASYLRDSHRAFYKRSADETERLLADEITAARAEDLGKIDTFRFEEEKVLKAALVALEKENWTLADEWARRRLAPQSGSISFWLRDNPSRRATWDLVAHAAQLGLAITNAGERLGVEADSNSLVLATEAYASRGAAVDRAHRQLEQLRASKLYPDLAEFEVLRARLDQMRSVWRTWADAWAREFSALCMADGFLPEAPFQQRTIFDDVVKPMANETGTTAYFVVDALRYEMAEQLLAEVKGEASTNAQLRPRLAELPTITAVGMNVLAPVSRDGRLALSLSTDMRHVQGFQAGEFRVFDPTTRKRAMRNRVGGGTCPWLVLDDVVNRDSSSLKQTIARANLVVVHSKEIDEAGENGAGPAVFEQVLRKLKAAWRLLRDAGVRRFVITSDHGFLLLDDTATAVQAYGLRIDPHRRHVFSSAAADHSGETRVALANLGYEGVEGHVMFPETTAVFDKGKVSMSFVHGGNSLQERVIPVLTIVHHGAAGGSMVAYRITKAKGGANLSGMHSLTAKVDIATQGALSFGGSETIELALRARGRNDVEVELVHSGEGAELRGGVLSATVGKEFQLYFRLKASKDDRVQVELFHPSAKAEVATCVLDERFDVSVVHARRPVEVAEPETAKPSDSAWVQEFDDPGVREVFGHLAAHGSVSESEATTMLGGARKHRRFALKFEEYARKAPFGVHVDVVSGVKRYVADRTK